MTDHANAPISTGGPVGNLREPGTVILLTIFTCGFYGLFWGFTNLTDLKNYRNDGKTGWLYLVPWYGQYLLADGVAKLYADAGEHTQVTSSTWCFLFIPYAGYFIFQSKVQNALNAFWEPRGGVPAS